MLLKCINGDCIIRKLKSSGACTNTYSYNGLFQVSGNGDTAWVDTHMSPY